MYLNLKIIIQNIHFFGMTDLRMTGICKYLSDLVQGTNGSVLPVNHREG
jgi:hypothetical protein